jgi:hypothetical protein
MDEGMTGKDMLRGVLLAPLALAACYPFYLVGHKKPAFQAGAEW